MPFTTTTPIPLHFEVHGEANAPALLLVMGLGFSSRAWDRLPERLATRFRVITFDNRYTGRSVGSPARAAGSPAGGDDARRSPGAAMKVLADDAAAVLDAAGVARAHVFGISMGGMIAQELALRRPERVRGLALGATFADFRTSDKAAPRTMVDLAISTAFSRRAFARANLARLLVSEEYLRENEARFHAWIDKVEFAGARASVRQMLAIRGHTTLERLAGIDAPTLVLTGDADRLVPASNSRVLAERIRGARLHLLSGVGHAFPLEREDETTEVLARHFEAG